jgi:hypothetical protein
LGPLLRLVGDAARLESEFGFRSLEALLWVAETVRNSVYVPNSLVRTSTGFTFALANPPLRIGAFSEIHLLVDGARVPPERVRFRVGPDAPWHTSTELGKDHPLELQSGSSSEFEADWPLEKRSEPLTVRLELRNVAVPPLVWLEIFESPREAPTR